MKRKLTGIFLAALAAYLWGMLYWGFSPLSYTSWGRSNGDEAAMAALKEHFPATGTYYLPGMYHDNETIARLYEQGPVGFVHITSRDGRSRDEPTVLIKGFVLYLAVAALLAHLLSMAKLSSYGSRVRLIALAGFTAALAIHIGDTVWWYLPMGWKLHQAAYDFSAWVIMGLVLGRFVKDAE